MTKFPALRAAALAAVFIIFYPANRVLAESDSARSVVLELFTSQGCSSCPAADRLLQQLAQRPGIIAMSMPVTYWDYLGWRDTLAKQEFTKRQRDYASARGDGEVYTPQVVVNGLKGCVGSDLSAIESAVRATSHVMDKERVDVNAHREGTRLIVDAGSAASGAGNRTGKVYVAAISRTVTVPIGKGENAGRTVTYINVVRKLVEAGEWRGAPTSYAVSLESFPKDADMLVVFIQVDRLGPIVAAAKIEG